MWPRGRNVGVWELEGCLDRESRDSEGDFRELRQAMKEKYKCEKTAVLSTSLSIHLYQ